MIQGSQLLAETLKRCGLVASATEAQRLAEHIVTTEHKVSRDFDTKKSVVEKGLERKPKDLGINELIEKTSFEKKDYYVPVKGYKCEPSICRDVEPEQEALPETKSAPVLEKAPPDDHEPTLNEIMNEDAQIIYGNVPLSREKEVKSPEISGDTLPNMEVVDLPAAEEISETPNLNPTEPEVQPPEICEEEKQREFKEPIPVVNLMDHFNFSSK